MILQTNCSGDHDSSDIPALHCVLVMLSPLIYTFTVVCRLILQNAVYIHPSSALLQHLTMTYDDALRHLWCRLSGDMGHKDFMQHLCTLAGSSLPLRGICLKKITRCLRILK